MAAVKRAPNNRCSLADILNRDAVGVDRKVHELYNVASLDHAKCNLNSLRLQTDVAHARMTSTSDKLKMTDKEVKDLRSAMGVLQNELEAERIKAKCFRDQIEKFKNDVQEKHFESQLEKLVIEVRRSVAEACAECRRYECKCNGHRIRDEWRGCQCGCAQTFPCHLDERLGPWTLEGMPKGLLLDCQGANGNEGLMIYPSL